MSLSRRSFTGAAAALGFRPAVPEPVSFAAPWTSPFRADPLYRHQLVNAEGEHLFLLNKTAWAYFGCKDPAGFLQRARAQGVNVIRVTLEGSPYFEHLSTELWPWGGTRENPEWSTFNQSYWNRVEERIRMAGNAGIGLDVTLYMRLHPAIGEVDAHRPYWQEILRRLDRYSNILTWEIANEYVRNEAFQDAAAAWLRGNTRHLVCTSDGTTDDAVWPHKSWMDLALVHTCTGSTPAHDLRDWYQAVARNVRAHGKPAFNNETGREGRHRNDDPVHRRKQGWTWCASGGFWTWHSWEGCEGINDASYRGPGAEFVRPMADFFRAIPFWRMDPAFTVFQPENRELVASVLCDAPRGIAIAYVCTRSSGEEVPESTARLRLARAAYRATFINPGDLSILGTADTAGKGPNAAAALALPAFRDDLVVKLERKA